MSHTSSPFSFHCMICFEEFDAHVCFPVVLPCGHTYICSPCANRLDKCMECRTSLFTSIPSTPSSNQPPASSSQASLNRSTMSIRTTQPSSEKPNPSTKVRIPLPKNVVLLSLMEAMDFASESAARSNTLSVTQSEHEDLSLSCSSFVNPESLAHEALDKAEEDDIEKIRLGTSIITGACGTYAVACKAGIILLPERFDAAPGKLQGTKRQTSNPWENQVNTFLQSVSSKDSMTSKEKDPSRRSNQNYVSDESKKQQMKLSYGDRVQVVSMVDGWAKLARGYGFIECKNSSDLVKVGGPVDKACSLEALINTLSLQRNRLKTEQSKLERIALVALREFQDSLVRDEDLTVICAEVFDSPIFKDESLKLPPSDEATVPWTALQPVDLNRSHTSIAVNSITTHSPEKVNGSSATNNSSPNRSIGNHNNTEFLTSGLFSVARKLLSGYGWSSQSPVRGQPPSSSASLGQSQISLEASRAMLAGAESWRRRNGREAARGIDFRTGMSGHYGIQGHHAHPHDYVNGDHNVFPKMSIHSGLTVGPSQNKPSYMLRALDCGASTADLFPSTSDSEVYPNRANPTSEAYHDQLLLSHLSSGVEFRTGFSGSSSVPSSQNCNRPFPKMSTHTGLTVKRGGKS